MPDPPEPADTDSPAIVPANPPNPFAVRLDVPLQITKENEGRCVSCGYFARWDSQTDPACEIDLFTRQSGRLSKSARYCFRQAVDLQGQIIFATAGWGDPEERVRAVVESDRHCSAWYPYQPGFSPKEHREEERMMRIEEDRKKHERRLVEMESEIANATKMLTSRGLIVAIIVMVLTAAAVIFAALGYFSAHDLTVHVTVTR